MSSDAPATEQPTMPPPTTTTTPPTITDPLELVSRLKTIRERLLSLRKAPSGSKEMARLWKEVSAIVRLLASTRSGEDAANLNLSQPGFDGYGQESPDSILEDIIPMFLQHLAKYKHTMQQLLETGLFTKALLKDLEHHIQTAETSVNSFKNTARTSLTQRISNAVLRRTSDTDSRSNSPTKSLGPGYTLLEAKLNSCVSLLKELKDALDAISPFLLPIHTRLVEIKHDLQQLIARRSAHAFSLAEVQMLQDELLEIDSARIDGSYLGKDGSVLPGQATVIWLLEQWRKSLRPVYESLIRIRTKLDHLEIVFKYTFKCDDLVPIQMELGEIDNKRVDGKFISPDGTIPEGQAVLHFLLHKVTPFFLKEQYLNFCFLELQRWKVKLSMRDLTMYQLKLAALDNQRVDGKFIGDDGSIPEGQGIYTNCWPNQASEESDDEEFDDEDEEGEENVDDEEEI
ncbi:hypothetical protein BCR33DRAFT_713611 [Rhizoclosmatium globosum]|uniref:Uncharacterized protein n=1 Tax=Rhizoclosmatium globosum TaxID=329046 RepID=A0A1Y2CSN7_9FUNG|nr:hypothetical protein BCR33DRAFT_713611 [Rhizoclosmatium globosum]|eukprot:ORY50021.1 hypothetical protein BCR33DRAFT_713611 [Rhizoclosmatium globosum]